MIKLSDVRRGDLADIFIRKLHSGQGRKKRIIFTTTEADLTRWRTTHLGNHVKKFMKQRPIGLFHMIGNISPDRLLAAEPKHASTAQIQRSNAAINANRKTSDRRIIVEPLEVLHILLQAGDFHFKLHSLCVTGR